jgi:hypothetical protein
MATVHDLVELLLRLKAKGAVLVASVQDPSMRMEVASANVRLAEFISHLIETVRSPHPEPAAIDDTAVELWRRRVDAIDERRLGSIVAMSRAFLGIVHVLARPEQLAAMASASTFVCARGHVYSPPAPATCDVDGTPVTRQP